MARKNQSRRKRRLASRALRLLAEEDARWQNVEIRARRYLNNIVEQDHRAVKQRCASMLGLKWFATAAVTLSGIELIHRIRKRQFTMPYEHGGRPRSLKDLWQRALSRDSTSQTPDNSNLPLTHQISIRKSVARARRPGVPRTIVRYPRKVSFGHSLYLLIMPNGARYWRYRYRFQGREKMMSLGCYPEVPTTSARARHQAARQLLASGVDPVRRRSMLRRISDLTTRLALDALRGPIIPSVPIHSHVESRKHVGWPAPWPVPVTKWVAGAGI